MPAEKVSIGQVKRDISDLVNRVAYGGERIILTSRGKPKAALVSIGDFERLDETETRPTKPLWEAESLEELVSLIRQLPPNPDAFHPAKGSLADSLRKAETETEVDFDRAAWEAEWAAVEAEMKRIELEDEARDLAEL